VPTVVGRSGVVQQLEIELWPKERMGLVNSAAVLRDTVGKVLN
jgi:L-lactate dehydrogenase